MASEVRSVTQALSILRLLADAQPLTLSETARLAGLGPSTCFNLLKTLLSEGAVVRDSPGKKYRLSDNWRRSGLFRDSEAHRLIEKARPLMARFAAKHDVTVGLWQVAPRDRLQLVAHAESQAVMVIRLANRQRQPLGSGAVGRAIAAVQGVPQDEVQRRFGAVRWHRDISFADYLAQVRSAGQLGYAVDDGYSHIGIATIAAVVVQPVIGFCFSASLFAGMRSAADVAALGEGLKALAALDQR